MDIKLDKSIYPIGSIRNAIYWCSSDIQLQLSENNSNYIVSSDELDADSKNRFLKSLNDFALREQINTESKDIKNLVISKAFYPDLVNFKNVGEYDDPVNIANKNGDK